MPNTYLRLDRTKQTTNGNQEIKQRLKSKYYSIKIERKSTKIGGGLGDSRTAAIINSRNNADKQRQDGRKRKRGRSPGR